jgi:hypothetical protein
MANAAIDALLGRISGHILDDRSSLGYNLSFELQTDPLKNMGKNGDGFDRFIYISKVPSLLFTVSANILATESGWISLLASVETDYEKTSQLSTLEGLYLEEANPSSGYFIINNTEYFGGSVSGTYYPKSITGGAPPDEFKIVEGSSASVSPSGYLSDGRAYYSSEYAPETLTRNSTMSLESTKSIQLLKGGPYGGYLLTSHSYSNPREISGKMYVDANRTYTIKQAIIKIT